MTGSTAIDIVIGLVFIYLIYSLLATIIQEIIATNLSFRAKMLEVAIIRMLNDDNPGANTLYVRISTILMMLFNRNNGDLTNGSLAHHFYKSALIKYLAQDKWHSRPSYISNKNFSKVMIDILRGENPKPGQDFRHTIQTCLDNGIAINKINADRNEVINHLQNVVQNTEHYSVFFESKNVKLKQEMKEAEEKEKTEEQEKEKADEKKKQKMKKVLQITNNPKSETLQFLRSLWADSNGDVERFKSLLEDWYDNTMERAVGWYKQYTQVILFVLGLLIAMAFNVDTLSIIDKLSSNPKLTSQLVQQADVFVKAHPNFNQELEDLRNANQSGVADTLKAQRDSLFSKTKALLDRDVENLNNVIGLGWKKKKDHETFYLLGLIPMEGFLCYYCNDVTASTHIGWLLTALAISLGAPFWFDLLNKLMKLKGSLSSSKKSSIEKNKEGAILGSRKRIEHESDGQRFSKCQSRVAKP